MKLGLFFAILLLFAFSFELNDSKQVCGYKVVTEVQEEPIRLHEPSGSHNGEEKGDLLRLEWVCQNKDEASTLELDQKDLEDEEKKKRVRRAWGSRRRSGGGSWSSRRRSGGGRAGGWSSRRRSSGSYTVSRRRTSWGSRRRTSVVTSGSRRRISLGSRRRTSVVPSGSRRRISLGSRRRTSVVPSGSRRRISLGSRRRTSVVPSSSRRRISWGSRRRTAGKKPSQKSKVWDKIHTALDVAGLVPGVGNIADGVNAGLHAARGNWKDAALSAAAMVPGAGQAATAAKLARKSKKASKSLSQFLKRSKPYVSKKGKVSTPHTNRKGKTERVHETDESFDTAKTIFERETGVKPNKSGVTYAKTKDGKYHLTARDKSKSSGEATLDVKDAKGDVTKIRCKGCVKD